MEGGMVISLGSGTAEDPDRYVVNEALFAAVEEGRWNIVMLHCLVRYARKAHQAGFRSDP